MATSMAIRKGAGMLRVVSRHVAGSSPSPPPSVASAAGMSSAAAAGAGGSGTVIATDTARALVPHTLSAPILGAGAGPLAGKTYVIKDLYDIEGRIKGNGNPIVLERASPAGSSAAVLLSLLQAGADCTGVSICDEFFYSITGVNHHYGAPENTHAPGHIPGGSSSGSAAATAARMCDFAIGSDTGGSVRIPASFCGVYGLRPTHGRISLEGATAMAPSFDVCGFFGRSAPLMQAVGSVLLPSATAVASPNASPSQLTVLLAEDAIARTTAPVEASLRAAVGRMVEGGAFAAPVSTTAAPPGRDLLQWWDEAFRVVQSWEVQHSPCDLLLVSYRFPIGCFRLFLD